MAGRGAHRGRGVDIGHEDDQPHQLTPDLVPRPGRKAPDSFEPALHAARERHPEDGRQHQAESTGRAQDLGRCGKQLGHRAGGRAVQAHAVDHPHGYAVMRGRAGRSDDDEQREHGQHGQRREAHGPFHELELLAAPMKFVDAEVGPDPAGASQQCVLDRPTRALAYLLLPHHATILRSRPYGQHRRKKQFSELCPALSGSNPQIPHLERTLPSAPTVSTPPPAETPVPSHTAQRAALNVADR